MSADKTVGGRTREVWASWARGLRATFMAHERYGPEMEAPPDLTPLIDAAFDSRGLREGLERAAKWHEAQAEVPTIGGSGPHQHRLWASALRSEASKLDGEERKCDCPGDYARYPGDDPHNAWCPRSRNPIVPEPPAEERKLPPGHPFDPVGDLGYATKLDICQHPIEHPAGDHVCGQLRSAHEPTR